MTPVRYKEVNNSVFLYGNSHVESILYKSILYDMINRLTYITYFQEDLPEYTVSRIPINT